MPTAICTTCQHIQQWPAKRGTRLADLHCANCHAPLVAASQRRCKHCRVLVWLPRSRVSAGAPCPNCGHTLPRFNDWSK